jgi:hypothetical protein
VSEDVDGVGPVPGAPLASRRADASSGPTGTGPVDVATTGDAAVDEALSVLEGLEERPLREHLDVLDSVHRALQDRLADAEG